MRRAKTWENVSADYGYARRGFHKKNGFKYGSPDHIVNIVPQEGIRHDLIVIF